MPTRETLLALRERVLKAEGADQELDAHLICALLAPADAFVEQSRFNGRWCVHEPTNYGERRSRLWEGAPREFRGVDDGPSASINAAIVLTRCALPGWSWSLDSCGRAEVQEPGHGDMGSFFEARAATPALAILAALLTALASPETTDV